LYKIYSGYILIYTQLYLDNGWRYGLGANAAPIGIGYIGI